jgi:soluble P-type ATPase
MTPGGEREQKEALIRQLGASSVVAIGNGSNDAGMMQTAAVSIAVIGREGLSGEALVEADVVVTHILDAIDLLLMPKRLSATLRR